MFRILVCGGRTFDNERLVNQILNKIHSWQPVDMVIHGDAKGADTLADIWANRNKIAVEPFPADWGKFGKQAGFIRNKEMLENRPALVVAFPGGKGTQNMVELALANGVDCYMVAN